MIRETLNSIAGVGIYPIISFVLFFTFFITMLIWVMRLTKNQTAELGNLPLDSDEQQNF